MRVDPSILLSSILVSVVLLAACDGADPPTTGSTGTETTSTGASGGTGGGGTAGHGHGGGGTGGAGGTGGMTGGGGTGGMPECTVDGDCGISDVCHAFACDAGVCNESFAPAGTTTAAQAFGDCKVNVCDGAGAIVSQDDDLDVFADQNDCTADTCVAGTPVNDATPAGTMCSSGAGKLCDGAKVCVECLTGADCVSGVCSVASTCAPASCGDGSLNGTETDVDCGGPVCGKCPADKVCDVAADCIDGVCDPATEVCQAATCQDGVKNAAETDVDCGGPTCADCVDGELCSTGADCQSTFCAGNPLSCQTMLNGCTLATATDMTNQAMVNIDFGGFFYTPKCVKVSPGTQVTWSGSFMSHPLQGGAVVNNVGFPDNSAIPPTNTGSTKTITFGAAGVFPYYCLFHVNSMQGVVFVQ